MKSGVEVDREELSIATRAKPANGIELDRAVRSKAERVALASSVVESDRAVRSRTAGQAPAKAEVEPDRAVPSNATSVAPMESARGRTSSSSTSETDSQAR